LEGRLEAAALQQPEVRVLRELLLKLGGIELVVPPKPDPDLPDLLVSGQVTGGSVVLKELEEGRCHENVAEMWVDKKYDLTAVATGYALSEDGLWRQHSWGIRNGEIVETTALRLKYFGKSMHGSDADEFARANEGDLADWRWRRLPEVWFRLEKDDDGYPPKEWEGLKSEKTGQPDTYKIKNVPFFARDVAYDDEVQAVVAEEGDYLAYSTVRLWMTSENEDSGALTTYLSDRACLVEFAPNFGNRLVAVGIPRAVFSEVYAFITAGREKGCWDAQHGYSDED
jgi:hypothetical protein